MCVFVSFSFAFPRFIFALHSNENLSEFSVSSRLTQYYSLSLSLFTVYKLFTLSIAVCFWRCCCLLNVFELSVFDCFFFSTIREGLATIDLKKKFIFFLFYFQQKLLIRVSLHFSHSAFNCVGCYLWFFVLCCVVVFCWLREATWCDGKFTHFQFSQALTRLFGLVFNNLSIEFLIHETFHQQRMLLLLPLQFRLHFFFHSRLGFSFCTPRKMADQHLKGAESEWRENLHKVIHNFHWFTETASFFSLHCVLRVVVYPQKYLVFNFVPLLRRRFGRWWWSVLCVFSPLSRLESTA